MTSKENNNLLELIKAGRFKPEQLAEMYHMGRITKSDLESIYSTKEIEDILKLSPEQHLKNINDGKYSISKIKDLVPDEIDPEYLVTFGGFSSEEIDEILEKKIDPIEIDWGNWADVPPLMEGRVDVFVLGIAGSGKSSFMAGLIRYTEKIGKLEKNINNLDGSKYADQLSDAVKNGLLPPPTRADYIQYMPCDFIGPTNERHPFSFVEMSGEIFTQSYARTKEAIPEKFKDYLFGENQKVLFLIIDYEIRKGRSILKTSQLSQFSFILQFLKENGILKKLEGICILVNKWDLCEDAHENAAKEFLEEEYLNLVRTVERFKEDVNQNYGRDLNFLLETFSLGTFTKSNKYSFDPSSARKIYNWLCSFGMVQKEKKRKKFRDWFR